MLIDGEYYSYETLLMKMVSCLDSRKDLKTPGKYSSNGFMMRTEIVYGARYSPKKLLRD